MRSERQRLIHSLFDEYIEMYAARDDRLTSRFSEDFSGYTGGGDFLVHDKDEWVRITRLDFSQVTGRIRIEQLDLTMQDVSDDIVIVSALFHIHLPTPEPIFARETVRLVVVFRLEGEDWKIVHSSFSIPYLKTASGEVFPLKRLQERNRELESLVEERTFELREANDKLEILSNTDWLTGIANRRNFDSTLAKEWNRAKRTGSPVALILLDVDLFKHFNDEYGHLAGDECLRVLTRTLTQVARRAGDLISRYGGEEFAVLMPNTSEEDALTVARRIQNDFSLLALPHAGASPGLVTASLGVVSLVPSRQSNPEELVRQADLALYRAKHSGRNCVKSSPN
ncbi:MAG: diguanylate cyclase [Acidobacteriota bacterium]|nr:diguanylate cyclase [Acidobacteriota bacterium]